MRATARHTHTHTSKEVTRRGHPRRSATFHCLPAHWAAVHTTSKGYHWLSSKCKCFCEHCPLRVNRSDRLQESGTLMASVMSQCTSTCRRRWQCVCVQVEKKAKAIALCDERRSPRTDLHRPVAVAERLCCCQLRGAVLPPVMNCKQASESNTANSASTTANPC